MLNILRLINENINVCLDQDFSLKSWGKKEVPFFLCIFLQVLLDLEGELEIISVYAVPSMQLECHLQSFKCVYFCSVNGGQRKIISSLFSLNVQKLCRILSK